MCSRVVTALTRCVRCSPPPPPEPRETALELALGYDKSKVSMDKAHRSVAISRNR
jgi:hypothetical protein